MENDKNAIGFYLILILKSSTVVFGDKFERFLETASKNGSSTAYMERSMHFTTNPRNTFLQALSEDQKSVRIPEPDLYTVTELKRVKRQPKAPRELGWESERLQR